MSIEIERRFIVRSNDWKAKALRSESITQGYISAERECVLRVRIVAKEGIETATLTLKGPMEAFAFARYEGEWEIPLTLAHHMMEHLAHGHLVVKNRYAVAGEHGIEWSVDVFEGENAGLVVAEVELMAEDQGFLLPDWIDPGDEITDDPRYTNAQLTKNPYTRWGEAFRK